MQRGQVLAEVGDSHDAQEPHLHLEVKSRRPPNGRSKSCAWRRSCAARSTAAGRQILSVRSPRAARLRHMHRAARQRKILAPSTQLRQRRRTRHCSTAMRRVDRAVAGASRATCLAPCAARTQHVDQQRNDHLGAADAKEAAERRQTRRRCTASAVHSAHALSCKASQRVKRSRRASATLAVRQEAVGRTWSLAEIGAAAYGGGCRGSQFLRAKSAYTRFQLGVLRLTRLALPLDVGHASRRGPTSVRRQSSETTVPPLLLERPTDTYDVRSPRICCAACGLLYQTTELPDWFAAQRAV